MVGMRKSYNPEALADYVEHFGKRVLQDALNEATASYWNRRAEQFEAVGNARCDAIALACRRKATIVMLRDSGDDPLPVNPTPEVGVPALEPFRGVEQNTTAMVICPACGTHTSPWTCSCGQTRVGEAG